MKRFALMFLGISLMCFSYDSVSSDFVLPESGESILKASHTVNHKAHKASGEDEAKAMRLKTVAIEAYTWGIREGSYYRMLEIQDNLDSLSYLLDKGYNFSKFVIDGRMLMPTALRAERIQVNSNDKESREALTSITLDKSPKIISQVPTWRNFLKRIAKPPVQPIRQSHPKNNEEIQLWDSEFKRGWVRGVKQADDTFQFDSNKLKTYFEGLYEFRFLLAQNVVYPPKLSKNETPVLLLDSGRTINLNDVKYRITLDAGFNKVEDWKPIMRRKDIRD